MPDSFPGSEERHIYVANLDGTGVVQLTSGPHANDDPAWSPDGARIAFESSREDGGFDVYVVELATGNVVKVAGADGGIYPDWSPDGSRIAFVQSGYVLTVAAEGGTPNRLAFESGAYDIAWSPDGTKIAFQGGNGNISYMNAEDGTGRALITDQGYFEGHITWRP